MPGQMMTPKSGSQGDSAHRARRGGDAPAPKSRSGCPPCVLETPRRPTGRRRRRGQQRQRPNPDGGRWCHSRPRAARPPIGASFGTRPNQGHQHRHRQRFRRRGASNIGTSNRDSNSNISSTNTGASASSTCDNGRRGHARPVAASPTRSLHRPDARAGAAHAVRGGEQRSRGRRLRALLAHGVASSFAGFVATESASVDRR